MNKSEQQGSSNSQSKLALEQFRKCISDCQLSDRSDVYLNKWLIARNYDVVEAENMLRQSLEWRRANKVDEILDTFTPPEAFVKYYSMNHIGTDKFDCPLWYSAQGHLDMIGLVLSATKKDVTRYNIWIVEEMARVLRVENELHGRKASCQTFILDMEGLTLRQVVYKPAMDASNEVIKMFEANYPENLRRIFVVNAPAIFTIAFKIIKPLLHQATVDKIKIYGCDKEEWVKALLEEIDADQLPVFYGGTLSDPDGNPKYVTKFNYGGEVPHEYYLSNSAPQPKDGMETMTVIAGAGGKKKIKFKVDVINSILRWEFLTEGGDISYRIYCKKRGDDSSIIELMPLDRVESHLIMEEGEITCEHIGKYVIEFDNTYSYVKTKKVRHLITIETPQ